VDGEDEVKDGRERVHRRSKRHEEQKEGKGEEREREREREREEGREPSAADRMMN